ncbi:hypothetical protein LCGC14_2266380 [marine sediment metagenome]|uniref:Uncharacterized protein n=1 Tax=marine sediment metagenome TaxID=412755 RepID=A0A0F9FTB4_9ZZZZ
MPKKVKAIPTPSQARIIRALRDYSIPDRPLWIDRYKWKPGYRGGEGKAPKLAAIDAPLNKSSIKVLDREGWIELIEQKIGYSTWIQKEWRVTEEGLAAIDGFEDEDFESTAALWTASDLLNVIEMRHPTPEWVFIRELRIGTGWVRQVKGEGEYIDGFALNCYPSKKYVKVAYEVKISRGDFLAELKNPDKREPFLRFSNQFFFVAPVGLINPEEVPEECGLIEIHGDSFAKVKVKAIWRACEKPTWSFMASLARNLSVDYKEYRDQFKS